MEFVCIVLAITVSSVASESAFSDAGNIVTADRNRLADELICLPLL